MTTKSREVRLKSRPVGLPEAANFEVATVDVADPGEALDVARLGGRVEQASVAARAAEAP